MSTELPIEIKNIVDICKDKGYYNVVPAIFYEYRSPETDNNNYNYADADKFWQEVKKSVGLEIVQSKDGGEGEGEYCYSVIKLDGKFFKAEWPYYSYGGWYFDDIQYTIQEVLPYEETVTVYR
jgi:hypothetical protein